MENSQCLSIFKSKLAPFDYFPHSSTHNLGKLVYCHLISKNKYFHGKFEPF